MQDSRAVRFPETSWGVVSLATGIDAATRQRALADICQNYWPPLYAFARHQGHSGPDAEDIVQGFFTELLANEKLSRADQARGKLRTFLISALKQHMSRERHHQTRLKRGGGVNTISLSEEEGEKHFLAVPSRDLTPDALFDRHWVLLLFDRTLSQLKAYYEQKQKTDHFEVFKHFLDVPEEQSYETASQAVGLSIESTRVAVHRFRRKYQDMLRDEIRQTIPDGEDPDRELQSLASD